MMPSVWLGRCVIGSLLVLGCCQSGPRALSVGGSQPSLSPSPPPPSPPVAATVVAAPIDGGAPVAPSVALPIQLGGPVPLGRGDAQRSGRSPYRLPLQAPKEVWRFQTQGAVLAPPTIASDGSVLFTSHDRHVYSLHSDGTLRWKHRTGDLSWSAVALSRDGLALVGSDDDRLYALRVSDGSVAWSVAPGGCRWAVGRGPEAARCDIEDVTLTGDGTSYVGGDGIYAVAADGKVAWRFHPSKDKERDKKLHCSSAPAVGLDGTIYGVCLDVLIALNPDGSKRWQFEGAGEFVSAPAVAADGTIYVGDESRRLLAIDPQGQQRFAFVAGGPVRAAPSLRRDGLIVFGAYDGQLYAVRPDGTLAWSFASADSIQSAPLVDIDGAVAFGSRDNRLYSLGPDGQLRWALVLDEDVDGSPALGPDGTLYIGSDDRSLHAFR